MPGTGLGNSKTFKRVMTSDTNLVAVQSGYTELAGFHVGGPNIATPNWLKLYDAPGVSSVTVGTTVPTMTLIIPPNAFNGHALIQPIKFLTGLVMAITAVAADNDSTAATAGGSVDLFIS